MKQTVYIASPESQQIHVWNLNHEGALTLTQVVDAGAGAADGGQPGQTLSLCWCAP